MARIPNAEDANGVWNIRQQRDAQYGGEWPSIPFWNGSRYIAQRGYSWPGMTSINEWQFLYKSMSGSVSASDWSGAAGNQLYSSSITGSTPVTDAKSKIIWWGGYTSGYPYIGWGQIKNVSDLNNAVASAANISTSDAYQSGGGGSSSDDRWIVTGGINQGTNIQYGAFDGATATYFGSLYSSVNGHCQTRHPSRSMIASPTSSGSSMAYVNPMSTGNAVDWGYNSYNASASTWVYFNNTNMACGVVGRTAFNGGGSANSIYWNPDSAGNAGDWGSSHVGLGNYGDGDCGDNDWMMYCCGNDDSNYDAIAYKAIWNVSSWAVGNADTSEGRYYGRGNSVVP